jgi:hypothetical protein
MDRINIMPVPPATIRDDSIARVFADYTDGGDKDDLGNTSRAEARRRVLSLKRLAEQGFAPPPHGRGSERADDWRSTYRAARASKR